MPVRDNARPEGPPNFSPNPHLRAFIRIYPHLPASSFEFSVHFRTLLAPFPPATRRNRPKAPIFRHAPRNTTHAHLTPGPRHPPFNGQRTTRPDADVGADNQPFNCQRTHSINNEPPRPILPPLLGDRVARSARPLSGH